MKRRVMFTLLTVSVVFCILASSACVKVTPPSPSQITATEHLAIQDGQLKSVTAAEQKSIARWADAGTDTVSLLTTYRYTGTQRVVDITFSNLAGVTGGENRLALADHVLELMGYAPEFISTMREETKLHYLSRDSLHAVSVFCYDDTNGGIYYCNGMAELTSGYPVEDTETDGSYRISTLAYFEMSTAGQWNVTLDSYYNFMSPMQVDVPFYPSVAVQNCRILPSESAIVSYKQNGTPVSQHYGTDSFETFADSLGGHGRVLAVEFPGSLTTLINEDFNVYISVIVQNSSVEPGGAFDIYGNFPYTNTGVASPTFRFPWGISATATWHPHHLKAELTAVRDG